MAADPYGMAAMQQDASYGPQGSPSAPSDAPPEIQGAPEQPEAPAAPPAIDLSMEITQAISAGCTSAKASATGEPEQIDPERYKAFCDGVYALCQGLAKLAPPAPAVDPNKAQADHTTAAKAVLQDNQHSDQMRVQLETARQREGRPPGPAKP